MTHFDPIVVSIFKVIRNQAVLACYQLNSASAFVTVGKTLPASFIFCLQMFFSNQNEQEIWLVYRFEFELRSKQSEYSYFQHTSVSEFVIYCEKKHCSPHFFACRNFSRSRLRLGGWFRWSIWNSNENSQSYHTFNISQPQHCMLLWKKHCLLHFFVCRYFCRFRMRHLG